MSTINQTTTQSQFSIRMYPSTPFLVLSYTVVIIAILLNSIEIKLILSKIKKATDFEIVLLNLAIADLFNSILFISVTVITQHSKQAKDKILNSGTFYWLTGTLSFSVIASVSFVAVIGIERFFAIRLPLHHRLWHANRRRLITYILVTWLFDVILVASFSITDFLRVNRNPNSISATVVYFVAGILTFGTGLILVVYTWVLYLMILRSLKLFNFDRKTIQVNNYRIKEAIIKEKSSIIICILVVVSCITCNIPLVADLFQLQITMTSALLLKVTGVLNPLIYFFKSYVEKYYAKKRLLSSYEERHNSNENRNHESNA